MELTKNILEVLVGLACEDSSVTEVLPPSSGLVVAVVVAGAEEAWRIDATTPAICCTASGDKALAEAEVLGDDTESGGMDDPAPIVEVAGGLRGGVSPSAIRDERVENSDKFRLRE